MISSGIKPAVRTLLEASIRAGAFPGAVAAWKVGDQPLEATWVGASSLVPRRVPTGQLTFYDLASLTKPLATATLAVLAMREGALELSTRVGQVLTAASGKPVGEATVLHLLTHTSGLPAWAPLYAMAKGDIGRVESALLELPLHAAPGSKVVYSCPGFILLGRMLELCLGQLLADLFRARVLEPVGLAAGLGPKPDRRHMAGGATRPAAERDMLRQLGLDPAAIPPLMPGLPDDGNARFLGGLAGNAGLWGTVSGVFELATHHLPGRSTLLTGDELELMAEAATAGGEQERGLGWQLASSPGCSAGPSLSSGSIGHTGFTGCSLWIDRHREAVLLLLANRHHPGHRDIDLHPLRRRFHSIVLG